MDNYCSNCGEALAGSRFCPNCGKPVAESDNKIEFVSTEYREPSQRIQELQEPHVNLKPITKKKGKTGCLILLIVVVFLIFAMVLGFVQASKNPEAYQTSKKETKSYGKEDYSNFDEKTWKDFKLLYTSHNNFMKYLASFSENKISSLDFYNACDDAEKYFAKFYNAIGYGTNKEEKDYLSAFESVAINDQLAAKNLMKYIDSGKTSDLSKAQDNIKLAKDAFTTIAINRASLLVKAGLTDNEIKEKIEIDMADLDTKDKK